MAMIIFLIKVAQQLMFTDKQPSFPFMQIRMTALYI